MNIDGCRIETQEEGIREHSGKVYDGVAEGYKRPNKSSFTHKTDWHMQPQGRWPANVILECTCETTEVVDVAASGSVSGEEPSEVTQDIFGKFKERKPFTAYPGKAVRHTNPECPCFMLDEQSGNTTSCMSPSNATPEGTIFGGHRSQGNLPMDSGGASRFFQTVRGDEPSAERTYEDQGSTNFAMKPGARRSDDGAASRFFYTAKADRTERNAGLEGLEANITRIGVERHKTNPMTGNATVDIPRQNHHPTVKPVDLMQYLCRLVTPPGGTVLDPFMGSGSTGIAALREGFEFIGIEIDASYAEIAEKRIKHDNPLFTEVEMKP
jgi:hypothetical protein